jgi:chitin disaccharide deacetylase
MVESELGRQLERFRELVGRDPTHLDSHQNVHMRDPFAAMFQQIARQLNVPLRVTRRMF